MCKLLILNIIKLLYLYYYLKKLCYITHSKKYPQKYQKYFRLILHRCLWRLLETKSAGGNYKTLVTVLDITNIHYLFTLASGTNIQRMLPTSKFCHQHPKIVTNITMTLTSLSLKITLGSKIYLPHLRPPLILHKIKTSIGDQRTGFLEIFSLFNGPGPAELHYEFMTLNFSKNIFL